MKMLIIIILFMLGLFVLHTQTDVKPIEFCKNTTIYIYQGNDVECYENCKIPEKIINEECSNVKIQTST